MAKTHKVKALASGTHWRRIDAQIERMARNDKENPATRVADWAEAVVGMPQLKTPVNARFDVDVVQWFKAQGRGYQTRMNAVLRRYMEAHRKVG